MLKTAQKEMPIISALKRNQSLPVVSVVIPARDEQGHIDACLSQLLKQTYPKNLMEILVVDGMSADKTRVVAANYAKNADKQTPFPLFRIIDNPKQQRAAALNLGVKNARGDVILRIDARTTVPLDYVEKCVDTLCRTGADNVGGVQKPIVLENETAAGGIAKKRFAQRAIGKALSHPFGVGNAQFRIGRKSGYVDTVYLGCFRRDVFDKVGLFDEDAPVISEDSEMNYKIRKAGGKVYLNTDIVAFYYPRDNFRDLWKLYFRYGGAKAGNFLKHKVLSPRQLAPPVMIITLFVLAVLAWFHPVFCFLLIVSLGIYAAADAAASLICAADERELKLFPLLLIAFPSMHFAWGLGFLKRLLIKPKPGTYWKY